MSGSQNYDYLIKLLLIGDSGVGKTCLLLRFAEDQFIPSYITTIGIDFRIKTIDYNGKKVKLQIWDTAGQERFRSITTSYYRGAQGIILVYDVTKESSFNNIQNWMQCIEKYAMSSVVKILIGNKCDNIDNVIVDNKRAHLLANNYNINFFTTSAKNDINVSESFMCITKLILEKMFQTIKEKNEEECPKDFPIGIEEESNSEASACCLK